MYLEELDEADNAGVFLVAGGCFWGCCDFWPLGKASTENSFIAALVLTMGDRGLFVPDSESESLKILFCARAFLSAVVNLTGLAASFSSDSDAAKDSELEKGNQIIFKKECLHFGHWIYLYLELRVKTVFLVWALFFWLPARPLAAPLTGFLRIAAAFLAAASAVVMNVLLSFWWPLFRILVVVGDRSSSDSLALVSENIRLYATLPVGSEVGTVAFLRYGLSFRIVALFSDTSPLNLKYVKMGEVKKYRFFRYSRFFGTYLDKITSKSLSLWTSASAWENVRS